MNRRAFVTLLGGAAAWPRVARAQQAAMPVIGFLSPTPPDGYAARLRAFRQGLKETGHAEGENVAIEYRWADNQSDRLAAAAADLVGRQVTVIVTTGGPNWALAAKAATTAIPIVFYMAGDPVAVGLVASLARPSGNLTGVTSLGVEVAPKRLELLRELVPGAGHIALLVNPANLTTTETMLREANAAARVVGLQIQVFKASTSLEINAAFATFARERPDAVLVVNDSFFASRRVHLATLAVRHSIPAAFALREFAEVGGLMSYGSNIGEAFRQVGVYTGRILKGARPADLPVVQASKFALVINLATAMMFGLEVPPTLLARADEVIE